MSVIAGRFAAYLAEREASRGLTGVWPPWHLRDLHEFERHPIGGACDECGRDVAIERGATFETALCLYCAMEAGFVPMIEIPPEYDGPPIYGVFTNEQRTRT